MLKKYWVVFCLLIISFALAVNSSQTITFQGKLLDNNGAAVNGSRTMTFALYSVDSGGSAIKTWSSLPVTVTNGLYSQELDMGTEDLTGKDNLYIEVQIGGETLSPRIHITSQYFALKAKNGVPVGTILMFAQATIPDGWLLCDGSTLDTGTHPEYQTLKNLLGATYGAEGKLPDFRGLFPKGAGTSAATPNYTADLGKFHQDQFQGHRHSLSNNTLVLRYYGGPGHYNIGDTGERYTLDVGDPTTDGTNGTPRTGKTTEPQNLGVNFIIKY
jgi:hypothetical protein